MLNSLSVIPETDTNYRVHFFIAEEMGSLLNNRVLYDKLVFNSFVILYIKDK